MARYRKLYPCFWRDNKVASLTAEQKLVALYCLTSPQTNRIGLYVLSPGQAAEECGMTQVNFLKHLDTVCHTLSWRYSEQARVLYIPTWWVWNKPDNEKAMKGALTDLAEVTQTQLTSEFANNKEHLSEGMAYLMDTVSDRVCAQEQEQEQEQDKEQEQKPPSPPRGGKSFDPANAELPPPISTDAFKAAWADWCKHRQQIKKPLTERSCAMQIKRFEQWGPERSIKAIEFTIEKGWQGIREPDATDGSACKWQAGLDEHLKGLEDEG